MRMNQWIKASRSLETNCVEVMNTGEQVLVRDTKDNGRGATLTFTKPEWAAFTESAKLGEFDI